MEGRFVDPWKPKRPGPFRVGDRVRMPFGGGFVEATIVEDHGNLGRGGKRLYGVCYSVEHVSGETCTVRDAEQLTLVAHALEPEAEKTNGVRE